MNASKKILGAVLIASTACAANGQSQQEKPATKHRGPRHKSAEQQLLEELNAKYDKLQQEVVDMKTQLAARDAELKATRAVATSAQTAATSAQTAAVQATQEAQTVKDTFAEKEKAVASLQSDVNDMAGTNAGLLETVLAAQRSSFNDMPEAIHYRGVDLRPGGFLAGETVNRQRGTGSDVNTQFASIPFAGQTAGNFSEFNAGGRQSRLSLLVEGKLQHAILRGYYEADFLSAGTTSNDNQSNSYTLRQRQVWAQAELDRKWIITAGQQWSLATEYRSGLTNTREATPLTIDAQYNVGFSWERQYGFRVVRNFNDKVWAGISVEAAQTLNIGGHNLPTIAYQQAGNAGGLYNPTANYSYNYAPDLIAKIAYEPRYGHFELFAVGRFFRDRVFPNGQVTPTNSVATANGAFTSKAQGGGLGVNGRMFFLQRKVELGAHILAGDGIGRYGTATLADATAHPDGSLELLTGGSALASIEAHPQPRLDLYAYYGGEYAKRAFYANGLTDTVTTSPTFGRPILVGYGAPTNVVTGCHTEVLPATSANGGGGVPGNPTSSNPCTADNRNIQEATLGYWYRFYKGPKGTLQQGFQYSYVVRHTWLGIGDPLAGLGGSPKAINNMWFTSLRYYLP